MTDKNGGLRRLKIEGKRKRQKSEVGSQEVYSHSNMNRGVRCKYKTHSLTYILYL